MKISIVTIYYNQAEFLERAIRSVVEQDYEDIEYIIVDPGSTDGSREIIEHYRSNIDKVIFEPDSGPADGLNKGFLLSTGDLCGYLNSDDAYLPGTFSKVISAFQSYPWADIIYGHGYMITSEEHILRRFYSDRFTPWRYVHGGAIVMQQSTFFKRQALVEGKGFNPDNHIWWDGELLLDFALAGKKMHVVNEFFSVFTIHEQSISGQRDKDTKRSHELDIVRQQTHARLYKKVMGYPINHRAKVWMVLARLQKWILQPIGTFWRVFEKLGINYNNKKIRI
jgi:glycosyltransferase involved in cell wall biosynthesis